MDPVSSFAKKTGLLNFQADNLQSIKKKKVFSSLYHNVEL